MSEHRALLEALSLDVSAVLETTIGGSVEIGLHGGWNDEQIDKRPMPIRVSLVQFSAPLTDCLILVSTMRDELLTEVSTATAQAVVAACNIECEFSAPEIHEFDAREVAEEQLDALLHEPTMNFGTAKGELAILVGSRLADAILVAQGKRSAPLDDDELMELAGALDFGGDQASPAGQSAAEAAGEAAAPAAAQAAPAAASENDQLVATATENARAASATASQWASLLTTVDVELSADLGSTRMSLGDITSLDADSVLTLDQVVEDPLTVYVNGARFATARLVVVGDEYGIEILELLGAAPADTVLAA